MKMLYLKLFNDANCEYHYSKKTLSMHDMAHFVSMKGDKYDSDRVRLFVIGRAVNGWTSLPCDSAEDFAMAAEQKYMSPGFTWVCDDGKRHYSTHNFDENGNPMYYLSDSPFWRVIEKVWRGLSGSEEFRFVDHIAWSNLYKISPNENLDQGIIAGNPTTTMCKKQFTACREILDAEIHQYKPTHILLITGYDSWYADKQCDFSTLFENNTRIGTNSEDSSVYVEGTAAYRLDGKIIPVVIACRPERRAESTLASAVLKAFNTGE